MVAKDNSNWWTKIVIVTLLAIAGSLFTMGYNAMTNKLDRIELNTTDLPALRKQIDQNQRDIDENKEDIRVANKRIDSLNGRVDKLEKGKS